jgi:hypothetical protein
MTTPEAPTPFSASPPSPSPSSLLLHVPVLDQRGAEAAALAGRHGLPDGQYLCGWLAMGVAAACAEYLRPAAAAATTTTTTVTASSLAALLSSLSDAGSLLPHVEAAMRHTLAYREAYMLARPEEFAAGPPAAAPSPSSPLALTTQWRGGGGEKWRRAWLSTWELCDWARGARSNPGPSSDVGVARRVLLSPAAAPFLRPGVGRLHECERLFLGEEAPFRKDQKDAPTKFPGAFAEVASVEGGRGEGWVAVEPVEAIPRRRAFLRSFDNLLLARRREGNEEERGEGEAVSSAFRIPRVWLVDAEGHYVVAVCVDVPAPRDPAEAAALPPSLRKWLVFDPKSPSDRDLSLSLSLSLTLVLDSLPESSVSSAMRDAAEGRACKAPVLTLLRGIHAAVFGSEEDAAVVVEGL